jgi:hypothetical protein
MPYEIMLWLSEQEPIDEEGADSVVAEFVDKLEDFYGKKSSGDFDYLLAISIQDLTAWIEEIRKKWLAANQNWVDTTQLLLEKLLEDDTNPVDIEDGLSLQEIDALETTAAALEEFKAAQSVAAMVKILNDADSPVRDILLSAHHVWGWRADNRGGQSPKKEDPDGSRSDMLAHIQQREKAIEKLLSTDLQAKAYRSQTEEEIVKLLSQYAEYKNRIDKDPAVPTEVSFDYMVEAIQSLSRLSNSGLHDPWFRKKISSVLENMVAALKLDANPDTLRTVIEYYS